MRNLRVAALAAAVVVAVMGGGTAYAFHAGGVAECGGCHSMHSPAAGGTFLLVGTDQSSACLTCHEHAGDTGPSSYHVSTAPADMPAGTAPLQRTPGGDFGWLKKTYTSVIRGNTVTESDTHGHNIIAADKGYAADSRNSTSPGGSYPNAQFHCNSCHDPHGKYRRAVGDTIATTGLPIKTSGSYNNTTLNEPDATAAVGVYRLLAGNGYEPASAIPGAGFPGVPPAKVKSGYNASEATSQVRVAYGVVIRAGNTTWGNWCGACHGAMHSSSNYVHPVDRGLGSIIKSRYDSYVKSGNMNGTNATAFSSLAPFATDAAATYATLNAASNSTAGPGSADQVNCMSCHRAHASGFQYMMRFDYEQPMFVVNGVYPTYLDRTPAETQAAYYDRPASVFATYQRVWCNKCHAKD